MKLNIIYEDKEILIVDKPAGLAVHAINKNDKRETLVSFLTNRFPGIKNVGENVLRPGIVHRLDKETSGLMVVALNNETFYELKKLFKERSIEKKYTALVSGIMEKDKDIIETGLVKIGTKTSIALRGSNIKSAITEYKVLKRYKEYTLVEIAPKTGRQHQIRVHFASINHPIACDKLYGRKAKKCPEGLDRHFLHASYLKFRLKHALMEFESKLPDDLAKTLTWIKS